MTHMKRRNFIAGLATAPFALKMMSEGRSFRANSPLEQKVDDPLDAHSIATTDLNTAKATAVFSLRGLGVACFGADGYESGFVPNTDHRYMLQIRELGPGANEATLVRPWTPITGDIRVEVINPVREGVFRYDDGRFTRPYGSTDERHFRWILNIEGGEMHGRKLNLRPVTSQGVRRLKRVVIPHATFFTKSLADYVYARVDAKNHAKERGDVLGRVAQEIGAAIECKPTAGSGIRLNFEGGRPLDLPWKEGLKYEINLHNLRRDYETHQSSDFPLYYTVLADPEGRQYNIAHVEAFFDKRRVPPGSKALGGNLYRRGCCGLACDKVFLGTSTSLSQPTA